jgi:hypothetical protein
LTHPSSAGKTIGTQWRAAAWLAAYAAAGIALAILWPDSYQQDGGTHFLFARDAWWNHTLLVDVWGRPLFTTLYALPARAGYLPAKLFTVLICVVAAWQCWRWAEDEGLARPELAIPFLALQPSLFLIMSETMTEPLFALVLVIALRLRRSGRSGAALIVASLLPLARPEGYFVCLLWGAWSIGDRHLGDAWWRRVRALPLLLTGMLAWWVAALVITKDPLFILHNWPRNWAPTGAEYGTAPWLDYWRQRYDIISNKLAWLFAIGFIALLVRRRVGTATALVTVLFVLHSILRHYGLFGSAGYPRYFVCVAPAIALITLAGWNVVVDAFQRMLEFVAPRARGPLRVLSYAFAIGLFLIAARNDLYFLDDHDSARDARAVADADRWLRAHSIAEHSLVWSQAYMCIIRHCDTRHRIWLSGDKSGNLALLAATPPGTLVFWDGETGPNWYGLHASDFVSAGFTELFDKRYELQPRFQRRLLYGNGWTRSQEMMLFYKYDGPPPALIQGDAR